MIKNTGLLFGAKCVCLCVRIGVYSRQRILVETETSYLPENKSFFVIHREETLLLQKNEINMEPYKLLYTVTE